MSVAVHLASLGVCVCMRIKIDVHTNNNKNNIFRICCKPSVLGDTIKHTYNFMGLQFTMFVLLLLVIFEFWIAYALLSKEVRILTFEHERVRCTFVFCNLSQWIAGSQCRSQLLYTCSVWCIREPYGIRRAAHQYFCCCWTLNGRVPSVDRCYYYGHTLSTVFDGYYELHDPNRSRRAQIDHRQ